MLSYMVQENHQEELNVIVCQVIMLPYFLSVNMKDPVGLILPNIELRRLK